MDIDEQRKYVFKIPYETNNGTIPEGTEIIHVFFLITSKQLITLDAEKHNYQKKIFNEAN